MKGWHFINYIEIDLYKDDFRHMFVIKRYDHM